MHTARAAFAISGSLHSRTKVLPRPAAFSDPDRFRYINDKSEFVLDLSKDLELCFLDNCERLFNAYAYTYWWRNYLEAEFELIHKLNRERS